MSDTSIVKTFWEQKHKTEDKAALSGCFYEETIDFLELNAYLNKESKVLEVGVGLGHVTKGLFDNDVEVSALDISDLSLSKVSKYCKNIFNLTQLEELPIDYFDVIICNNVVQHVTTDLLTKELEILLASLSSTGVLAIEFVSNTTFEDNGANPSFEEIKNGGLCRSTAYLEQLINNVGGKCSLVFSKKVDISIVHGHHVFHVRRRAL